MSKKGGTRKRLNSTSDFETLSKWPCFENYSFTDPLGLEVLKQEREEKDQHNAETTPESQNKRKRNAASQAARRLKSKSAEKSKSEDEEGVKSQSIKRIKGRKSQSVEKRNSLNVSSLLESKPAIDKFQYGNYRNWGKASEDILEQRMKIFRRFRRLFEHRSILDVGCGTGSVARALLSLGCSKVVGVDRDSSLIRSANNASQKLRTDNQPAFSLSFKVHNFVPPDVGASGSTGPQSVLDAISCEYDSVLMLSVSKWIHLTYGDMGLKSCFAKVYRLLKKGGAFVLECQMWPSYKQSRKINDAMFRNFNSIQLFPNQFPKYLVDSCQFSSYHHIGDIEKKKGKKTFKRPIFVFYKL